MDERGIQREKVFGLSYEVVSNISISLLYKFVKTKYNNIICTLSTVHSLRQCLALHVKHNDLTREMNWNLNIIGCTPLTWNNKTR